MAEKMAAWRKQKQNNKDEDETEIVGWVYQIKMSSSLKRFTKTGMICRVDENWNQTDSYFRQSFSFYAGCYTLKLLNVELIYLLADLSYA